MSPWIKTYAPLLLSLTLGGLIILLVLRIVGFSDAVTSYYTPAILNFEDLLEGSQHLKMVLGDEDRHEPSGSIAARHFSISLDRLINLGNTAWPGDHRGPLDEVLVAAGHVRESLSSRNSASLAASLDALLPLLAKHTQEHKMELENARRSIRVSTISAGLLSLFLTVLGYVATMRERRVAELLAREKDVEQIIRHDIKSPLSGLIGLPSLLLEDENLTETQRSLLKVSVTTGRKILNLINSSLALHKIEDGTYRCMPQDCQPAELVQENIEILAFAKHVEPSVFQVREHGPDSVCANLTLWTDSLLLDIILMNLLRNALEASDPRAPVSVDLSWRDSGIVIAIANSRSVPSEIRGRFFEKYVTSGKVGGTGLGTYSAMIMTRAIGGTIDMETSDESGTIVTLRIPQGPEPDPKRLQPA